MLSPGAQARTQTAAPMDEPAELPRVDTIPSHRGQQWGAEGVGEDETLP